MYNIKNKNDETSLSFSTNQNIINFLKLLEELLENAKNDNFLILNLLLN